MNLNDFLPYNFLGLSVISLWINKKITPYLVILTILIGLYFGRITLIGLSGIFLVGLSFWCFQKNSKKWIRVLSGLIFFGIAYLLFSHIYPGFNNLKVFDNYQFSEMSSPFTMYMNFDKPFISLVCFYLLGVDKGFTSLDFWKKIIIIAPLAVIFLLGPAIGINYLKWDFKFDPNMLVWGINNLIFVCAAEEVIFRRVIQGGLSSKLESLHKHGPWIALILASILFGLAHFKGGVSYILLSTIAGIFYGYSYKTTKSIEASILVHFFVNSFHIVFLTYPYVGTVYGN